ncbi:hypothetical protein KAJ27_18240, partial [bacterium]|nr:hypothetical protein [bacterium]
VSALGGIKDESALYILEELIERIQKKKKTVFVEEKLLILSAEALLNCGSHDGMKILMNKLKDTDSRVVEQSVAALSRVGGLGSVKKIIDVIKRQNPKIKNLFSALKLMYHRHKPAWQKNDKLIKYVRKIILRCIKSNIAEYRFSAVWLAGELNERKLIPYLKKLLNDSDSQVKNQSAHSLCFLGDKSGLDIVLKDLDGTGEFSDDTKKKSLRRDAARCLRNIRRKGIAKNLVKVLDDEDDVLVNNAIFSIYMIGDTSVLGTLENILKRTGNNSERKNLLKKTIKAFKLQNSYIHPGVEDKNVEKITIKARNIEVWRLFRMINKITGKRIVLNPGVEGTLTYSARDKHYLDVIRQIAGKMNFRVKETKNMIEIFKK